MNHFLTDQDTVSNPARGHAAVLLSDSANLDTVPKALFVGTSGDVRLRAVEDEDPAIFRNVGDGQFLLIRAQQVYATGTVASDTVALL